MQIVTITFHHTNKTVTIECATPADVTEAFESYGVERRFAVRAERNKFVGGGMTVTVTEAPAIVTAADLDAKGYETNSDRLHELAKSHYRPIPFWQDGAASTAAKNEIRRLINLHAGTETAELVRWILNDMRAEGAVIDRSTVENYTRLLKSL